MSGKIKEREELIELAARARGAGRLVAFTSGVFDILHPGHVDCLARARALADLLIVGVNSDESVRICKGPRRPIHDQRSRAEVVAGLAAVDYVFVFDELDTRRSVELLRPDRYIKGGDYTAARLRSAPIVQEYGGCTVILPFRAGHSTSETIRRIISRYADEPRCLALDPPPPGPAVFLDRDGTIIEHVDYLHDPARVTLIPGALDAIKLLREHGYRIVVVTNQPGIGTGYFSKEEFFQVNKAMLSAAARAGALFDRIFYCPHSKGDGCTCRKPLPGMIDRAGQELNIDPAGSFVVGDMTCDVQLGKNAGCRTILVQTGRAGRDAEYDARPDHIVPDLCAAARLICASPAGASGGLTAYAANNAHTAASKTVQRS